MIGWLQDLRYAIRQLRKSPGFAFASILTLAVAIGANAVVFGALDALILRPLDVPHPENLYSLAHQNDAFGYESYMNYVDLRDRNHTFDALVADNIVAAGLDIGEGPERGWGYETSGNFFDAMELKPYLGRFFHASDEHGPNSAAFIVLTYRYWQNHFKGDRGVIGRTVLLNKHPFTIIGVAAPGFVGTFPAFAGEFLIPIVNQEQVDGENLLNSRGRRWVSDVIGRLKPGITSAQAAADLNAIEAELEKNYPKDVSHVAFALVRPGIADVFGGAVKAFMAGLMLLAALILLAACANLGTLFAARAGDRSREVALRLALGSSRKRILRGLLSEALLISMVGGGIGLWTSVMLLRALSSWRPFPEFPLNLPLNPGANVYLVALLLALVSGFLFGAVPVRQVLRTSPYEVIKLGTNPSVGRRFTARDVLLAGQIAICAVLVTSSLVALRGLTRSLHSHLGVEPNGALLVETDPSHAGFEADAIPVVQKRLIDELQTIPGVTSVGMVSPDPPLHMGWMNTNVFTDQTVDLRASNAAAEVLLYQVSPEYMQAAGTTLVTGRNLSWHDDKASPRVAVVNREFAHRVFGSQDRALGAYFKRRDGTRIQVVGITEDGKYTANIAERPTCAMFLPILQSPSNDTWFVLRSTRDPQQLAAAVRTKFRDVDAGLPSFIQTWENEMNGALFASRMAAMTLGVLGAMGAMLSVTGIFGMAAYSVSKRLRELGIRVALGAQRKEILRASLGRAYNLLAFGSTAGLLLGLLASRVLSYIVYQATPRDPAVLVGVVVSMALLGLLATWIPARRALLVDPVILLREE
ncbi:MAG TPA: ABC transporter permease [Candidatus Sulfotelmatobacter sp.]|nr:ABC transporter permease [Candidatus Sulfotelmatobacter sp.]